MENDQGGFRISRKVAIVAAASVSVPVLLGIGFLIGQASRETVVRHQLDFGAAVASDPNLRDTKAKLDKIKGALQLFALSTRSLPTTAEGLASLRKEKWRSLIEARGEKVGDSTHDMLIDHSLSDSDLIDGWGQPFRYASPRKGHKVSYSAGASTLSADGYYDLWSAGPDGVDGTADDVAR